MALTKVDSILVDGAINTDASGNVGIVTSSPRDVSGYVSLALNDTTGGLLDFYATGTRVGTVSGNSSNMSLSTVTAIPMVFSTNTNEAMRIDSGGRLNIGTSSNYNLAVLNLYRNSTDASALVQNIYNNAATLTTKKSNVILRVSSNGSGADAYINITDNVANNYNFGGNNGGAYVQANTNGVRLTDGATSWSSDSDERVKDIIEPITDAANKVSTLRAVIGKYKTDEEGTRRSFLIAQDVQAVLPEAVVAQQDEIGTLSLAYTDTIPLLVAAIQEQQAIITDLKARIETLEAK
jgi:hypothetical protein